MSVTFNIQLICEECGTTLGYKPITSHRLTQRFIAPVCLNCVANAKEQGRLKEMKEKKEAENSMGVVDIEVVGAGKAADDE